MGYTTGTKWNYELVKETLWLKGYVLVDLVYVNANTKLTFYDSEGYWYYQSITVFLRGGQNRAKFNEANPYTIQNIKFWCKLNNKPFELISDVYKNAKTKMEWKCLKENCRESFFADWNDIFQGNGCGVCSGLQVTLTNCLATKNPELAKEWHPTKNGNLTPHDVTCGSNKKVWWKCERGHEWNIDVATRFRGNSCPYCSHQLPSKDYNLLIYNPELCEEWDYSKNDKKPEEYCPNSGEKVWWKCKECDYEWQASILNRNGKYKTGCPKCNKSKGENRINRFLDSIHIHYIPQKKFKDLIGIGGRHLSYDAFLPDDNLLIEYQGEFHDGHRNVSCIQTKDMLFKQQEHDRFKKEYAQRHDIKLLEIWYWDFDNIEEILSKTLQ